MMCEACERGHHANCGMQTWCECDCDPDAVDYFEDPMEGVLDPENAEDA